jgi:hypothetical protein
MVEALHGLADQPAPSERGAARMLRGLDAINRLVGAELRKRRRPLGVAAFNGRIAAGS